MSDTLSGGTAAGGPGPDTAVVTPVAGAVLPAGPAPVAPRRRGEFAHYALRNPKLIFGLSLEALFVLAAVLGPLVSPHGTAEFFLPHQAPSAQHWMGTDYFGHDVFAQLAGGLRTSYLVGALGALFHRDQRYRPQHGVLPVPGDRAAVRQLHAARGQL
jgi:peptide/nickel transport system permease protein